MGSLRVEMLPAAEGDAILVTWGSDEARHRMLIDGGRRSSYTAMRERLLAIPRDVHGRRRLDLVIVTHVDADHIEGIICLVQDAELALSVGDVWFNDWKHLEPLVAGEVPSHLGPEQGEFLGALLEKHGLPWNQAFAGEAIVCVPEARAFPSRDLPGGLTLTIVSPTVERLIDLRMTWSDVIKAAGFVPGNREEALAQFASKQWAKLPAGVQPLGSESDPKTLDDKVANGSSIAVLAEFGASRLLLTGDAWPQVLRPSLEKWSEGGAFGSTRIPLELLKVPHHGSSANMTPELLAVIECSNYMISTSGARYRHPHFEAISMIIDEHAASSVPNLLFNYRSEYTAPWTDDTRCQALYEDDAVLEIDA